MACLDDNTLLAFVERALPAAELQSVSDHLDTCETCLTIACAVAASEAETADGGLTTGGTGRLPRDMVGRYALIEMIGRGGMGSVFVAHDPQLDRKVALKVVRAERFEEPEVRARLSREARAMAKIVHPHVVTVFDAGELEDGVFIAMELVDGHTLGAWLAAAPRTWRDIVRLFVTVGRGLAAAHAAGIVHRDFKPDNVLVDRAGRAAVTDFGLAVAFTAPVEQTGALAALPIADAMERSRMGALVGTPLYMAPEQFTGKPVDARSDQFSFAVALWGALYGQRPFEGETLGALMDAVTAGRLQPRPARTAVPARVHRVLERALRTAPDARYPDLPALLDQLQLAMQPRWPRAAGAGALLAVAATTALVLARRGPDEAAPPRPGSALAAVAIAPAPVVGVGSDAPRVVVIVAPFTNQTGDERFDGTLEEAVATVLYRSTRIDALLGPALADFEARAGSGTTADDVAAQVIASGRPTIVVHGEVTGDAGHGFTMTLDARSSPGVPAVAPARASATSADAMIAAAQQAGVEIPTALRDPPAPGSFAHALSPSLGAVHAWVRAQRFALAGDAKSQVAALREALATDPGFVEAHAMLGLVYANAEKAREAAQELEIAARDGDHMAERQRLGILGDYYDSIGRHADAVSEYQLVLAKWPGDMRTEVAATAAAIEESNFSVALEHARQAAVGHANLDVVAGNLIGAEVANGLFDDAERDGEKMFAAVAHPSTNGIVYLALAHALHDDPDGARAVLAKLPETEPEMLLAASADLAIFERKLPEAEAMLVAWIAAHPAAEVGSEQLYLAQVRMLRGDHAGALRARDANTKAMGDDFGGPQFSYVFASLGVEAGAAGTAAAKSAAWRERDSVDWRISGELLAGDLALAAGKPPDAIAAYQRAGRLGHLWMQRARLGRAYLAAHAYEDAERELQWCRDHRGEGAVYMLPSLVLLADVDRLLAKLRAATGPR